VELTNEKRRVLSPRSFFQHISKGEIPSIVLFINCKGGLWDKAITRLREDLLGEQWKMHYAEFEGKEASLEEISNKLLTTPFMGMRRIVVVREAEEFWKSLGKKREDLLKFLSSYKGKNLLALAANGDLDVLSPSRKTHPLASLVTSKGIIVTMKPKNKTELRQWIEREMSKAGVEKDPAFVDWLIEESEGNVGFIENEIEKRALSVGETEELSFTASLSQFKMEIATGNPRALKSVEELLNQGHPPLYIMGIITNMVRNAVVVYEEAKKARSIEVGFQKARIYRSEKETIFNLLKNHPKGKIYRVFNLLQQADRTLKSSSTPPLTVLQQVIIGLSQN